MYIQYLTSTFMYLFKLCIVVKYALFSVVRIYFLATVGLTLMEAAGRYVRTTVRTQPVYS